MSRTESRDANQAIELSASPAERPGFVCSYDMYWPVAHTRVMIGRRPTTGAVADDRVVAEPLARSERVPEPKGSWCAGGAQALRVAVTTDRWNSSVDLRFRLRPMGPRDRNRAASQRRTIQITSRLEPHASYRVA